MVILTPAHKRWGIFVFIMSFIGALVETLGVSVILPLVQAMLEPEMLFENDIISYICHVLEIADAKQLIVVIVIGVILVYLFKNVYLCLLSYVRVKYSTKVQRELSLQMLYSYMGRGYSFFRLTNTATLLRGVNSSVAGVYNIIYQFMRILAEVLTITCIFIFVVYTDWKMAVTMIALVGVCLLLVLHIFKDITKRAGNKYFIHAALMEKWVLQLFSGIKEVLVLNRKDFFVSNYEKSYREYQDGQIKQTVAYETPAYVIEAMCVTGIVGALCIRVGNMENVASFIPQLAAFAMAAFRLLPSIGRISAYFNSCVFSIPTVGEVYENIVEAKKYEEKQSSISKLYNNDMNISFNKEMTIKDIVWKYPDGTENVLDHISLTIRKGDSVALVGPSGAGKSTLADIILGLFEPPEGSVLIDGMNILGNNDSVSKIISFVPQSIYLLDDTVRRNIAFGIYDKDIDDDAIWYALEQAQMKDFIKELPQGLDTIVGERGVRFSGGQSQRIAIARALYTDPDIIVLDEATSALDSETETTVMKAIESLQGQKTLIIIAHRLSTIRKCDKIYEISNGRVVEKNYEDLI